MATFPPGWKNNLEVYRVSTTTYEKPKEINGDELDKKCTQGDWILPHRFDDSIDCDCLYVFGKYQDHEGCVCTIGMNNGKKVGEGGNGGAPYEEAYANAIIIINAKKYKARAEQAEKKLQEIQDNVEKGKKDIEEIKQLEELKEFVRDIIRRESWGDPEMDGGTIEEWAKERGWLAYCEVTEENIDKFVNCEVGDGGLVFTGLLEIKDKEV